MERLVSSDRNNDNPNLPPWLRDVPLPPRPREDNAAPPPPPAPQPGDALPAWLRDRHGLVDRATALSLEGEGAITGGLQTYLGQ